MKKKKKTFRRRRGVKILSIERRVTSMFFASQSHLVCQGKWEEFPTLIKHGSKQFLIYSMIHQIKETIFYACLKYEINKVNYHFHQIQKQLTEIKVLRKKKETWRIDWAAEKRSAEERSMIGSFRASIFLSFALYWSALQLSCPARTNKTNIKCLVF